MTIRKIEGTFTASGDSDFLVIASGHSLVQVSLEFGGDATVEVQRSFDDGATWKTVKVYTASAEEQFEDYELGNQYRYSCTSYTDDVTYRMSF